MSFESPIGVEKDEIARSKEEVRHILEHLKVDLHFELSPDVTSIYNEMSKDNLLARVENIESVIECIDSDKPISVGSIDKHYANSVAAVPDGLRIAMAEADAPGPVRLLIGLEAKSLIGFKGDHLEVNEIDDNEFDLRDTNLRKAYCRHISGEIRREDIKYLVLRIPRKLIPEEELLPEEEAKPAPFVFRGARIDIEADSAKLERAA